MKVCLACGRHHGAPGWCCPTCGHAPPVVDGFPAFAPALERDGDGFVESYFDELAPLEARSFWFRARNRLIVWALATYFPTAGDVLEVGCGTGFVLAGIRDAFPGVRLAGSDVFTRGLTFAQRRVPDATLFQMDARAVPFADAFDVVGAFDVLEHVDEDERVLTQLHQACRPGGGIIVTVPQHMALWSRNDEAACHRRRYSRSELVRKVTAAGFRVARATSFVSLPLPLMALSRLRARGTHAGYDPLAELKLPTALDRTLGAMLAAERAAIRGGLSLPAGGSLLLIARRAADSRPVATP